jgi:hypothetical protein
MSITTKAEFINTLNLIIAEYKPYTKTFKLQYINKRKIENPLLDIRTISEDEILREHNTYSEDILQKIKNLYKNHYNSSNSSIQSDTYLIAIKRIIDNSSKNARYIFDYEILPLYEKKIQEIYDEIIANKIREREAKEARVKEQKEINQKEETEKQAKIKEIVQLLEKIFIISEEEKKDPLYSSSDDIYFNIIARIYNTYDIFQNKIEKFRESEEPNIVKYFYLYDEAANDLLNYKDVMLLFILTDLFITNFTNDISIDYDTIQTNNDYIYYISKYHGYDIEASYTSTLFNNTYTYKDKDYDNLIQEAINKQIITIDLLFIEIEFLIKKIFYKYTKLESNEFEFFYYKIYFQEFINLYPVLLQNILNVYIIYFNKNYYLDILNINDDIYNNILITYGISPNPTPTEKTENIVQFTESLYNELKNFIKIYNILYKYYTYYHSYLSLSDKDKSNVISLFHIIRNNINIFNDILIAIIENNSSNKIKIPEYIFENIKNIQILLKSEVSVGGKNKPKKLKYKRILKKY